MKRIRTKHVVWALVILSLAGLGLWYQLRKNAQSQVQYERRSVSRGDLRITIIATGKVEPESRLEIKPPIAGRIEEIKFDEGATVNKGQIIAYMSSTDRAALLDLARSKGSQEEAALTDIYRPTPLIAPISGTIIAKNVEPGQMITAQEVAFVLSDRPIVAAQVDETDLARISIGQMVEVTLDAFPDDPFTGEVFQIAFESKTVNNVTIYDVKIRPKEPLTILRSGMTANVNFRADEKKNVLLVPVALTQQEGGTTNVLVPDPSKGKKADREPIKQTIKVGLSDGKMVEVLEGLAEGDIVLEAINNNNGATGSGSRNPMNPFGGQRPRQR